MTTTPVTPRLAQHEREMLIGAFLDITNGQFSDGAPVVRIKPDDDQDYEVVLTDGTLMRDDAKEQFMAYTISLLGTANAETPEILAEHSQQCAQALALMSDSTLAYLVDLFGTNPLNAT